MRTREEVQTLLSYLRSGGVEVTDEAEEAIVTAYSQDGDRQSLAIKILSIFGGIFASIAFIGFLFLAGLYDSPTAILVCGLLCLVGAVAINRVSEKIITDTASVSFFIIGYVLFEIGLLQMHVHESLACILAIVVSIACLFIGRGYILSFLSVLIANGGILTLIVINRQYNLIHLHVVVLSLLMTYFYLKEASIVSRGGFWMKLYDPVRTGLLFSLLGGLACLGKQGLLPISPRFIWLSSVGILISIVIVLFDIFKILKVEEVRHKATILVLTGIMVVPTAFSPGISGALLILLLGFLVNHKTGIAVGIAAFVYFVSQYYYDLQFTLLTKSLLLFFSGVLFLLIYFFTQKRLNDHVEK